MFGFGKLDWSDYPNFSADEFACSHCGENKIKKELLDKLKELRTYLQYLRASQEQTQEYNPQAMSGTNQSLISSYT